MPNARPWSPVGIFAWTLLGGPLVGGAYAAFNTRRLGLRGLLAPTVLMALVTLAFPIVVRVWLWHVPATSPAAWNLGLMFRVLAAYYFSYTQREAFWEHVDGGGQRAGGFVPTLVSVVLFVVEIVFAFRPA